MAREIGYQIRKCITWKDEKDEKEEKEKKINKQNEEKSETTAEKEVEEDDNEMEAETS